MIYEIDVFTYLDTLNLFNWTDCYRRFEESYFPNRKEIEVLIYRNPTIQNFIGGNFGSDSIIIFNQFGLSIRPFAK